MESINEKDSESRYSFFGVFIAIVFGFIFITAEIKQAPNTDTLGWWWTTGWSILAMFIGFKGTFHTDKMIQNQLYDAKKLNKLVGLNLWPTDKKQLNAPFTKALAIVFLLIGVVVFIKNMLVLI